MFCPKCGSKSIEGSAFCQKCGAKLITDNTSQQAPVAPTPKPVIPAPAPQSPFSTTPQTPTAVEPKKKSKKLLFGIMGVALLAVITIIITVSIGSGGDDTDLFQIAQNVSPMTDSGFDATYGDVFKWLMTGMGTRLEQQGNAANLTFSGKVTGGDYPVSVVLRITGLGSNNARVIPYTMTLNDIEVPDFNDPKGVLADLFWAHDNRSDYKTFMDFVRWDNENAFGTFRSFLEDQNGGTVAASSNSELVGQWEPISDDFIEFFHPLDMEILLDGTVIVHGNLSDITGSWVDSGNGQLNVTDENSDTYMFRYEISGDQLTLTDSSGDSSVFRRVGGVGGSNGQGQSEMDIYFVQRDESLQEEYQPMLTLHQDGSFTFLVNLLYGMGHASGTYDQFGNQYTLYIMESDFGNYDTFAMEVDGDSLIYRGENQIGTTTPGAVFYRTEGVLSSTSNWDKVLYKNEPIINWMGARLADLRNVFGAPDIEGIVGEGAAYGFSYEDWGMVFIKRDQGEDIESISGVPSLLSVDGTALDTNRDQLVSLFGDPVYEDWGDEEYYAMLGMDNSYYMQFSYQGMYSISFELDDPNGKAWSFLISYSNDDSGDAYSDEYNASSDPVTADGSVLSVGSLVYAKQSVNYVRGYVTSIDSANSVNVAWSTVLENNLWGYKECAIFSDNYSISGYSYSSSATGATVQLVGLKSNLSANELYSKMP